MDNRRISEVDEISSGDSAQITLRDAITGEVIRHVDADNVSGMTVHSDLQLVTDLVTDVREPSLYARDQLSRIMSDGELKMRMFRWALLRVKMDEATKLSYFIQKVRKNLLDPVRLEHAETEDLAKIYTLLQNEMNNTMKLLEKADTAGDIPMSMEGDVACEQEMEISLNVKQKERVRGVLEDFSKVLKNESSGVSSD